jgi:hypothetical protein
MLVKDPIVMVSTSALTTELYQMLEFGPITTLPTTIAPGATKTVSSILGLIPSYG